MSDPEGDRAAELARKVAQEVEIDHLLAEEFACDPGFTAFVCLRCGDPEDCHVVNAIAEPSLDGNGFGYLLITLAHDDGVRRVLLIEDKITAGAGVRQAERYRQLSEANVGSRWDDYRSVLVAPARYVGERGSYDIFVRLEDVRDAIRSPSSARLAHRRAIIDRAIAKPVVFGVKVPDPAMRALHLAYAEFVGRSPRTAAPGLVPDRVKDAYHDGDSWFYLRSPSLDPVYVRHRLYTSVRNDVGMVDLIIPPALLPRGATLSELAPVSAKPSTMGKSGAWQVSFPVPPLRQRPGFDIVVAEAAMESAVALIDWWTETRDVTDRGRQ